MARKTMSLKLTEETANLLHKKANEAGISNGALGNRALHAALRKVLPKEEQQIFEDGFEYLDEDYEEAE